MYDSNNTFVVDMSQTTYLDSSALGMLLLFKEHAGDRASDITIRGSTPNVKKILDVSQFDKLFTIE